jgi:hypothetical protein
MTPLDAAHAAMDAADGEGPSRAFWGLVAASELHLWLEEEPQGELLSPRVFEAGGNRYALAFDTEERLAAFARGPSPYATLSGRRLAASLAEARLGLGLNFGAPSETLVSSDVVVWIAEMGSQALSLESARPAELAPPTLSPEVVAALDGRLAAAAGLARCAWLARAVWDDGGTSHLLAIEEVVEGATEPLARLIAEALAFGEEAVDLDLTSVSPGSTLAERLDRVGLRFEIAEPSQTLASDPDRPPRLR